MSRPNWLPSPTEIWNCSSLPIDSLREIGIGQSAGHVHLVGCCGSGMRALAGLLLDLGYSLTGSDLTSPADGMPRLIQQGLVYQQGHAEHHVPPNTQVLVHSQAIGPENPERSIAAARGIPQFTYSQMLGELMRNRDGVCIAGTHGKSTTTALTACLLNDAGHKPSAIFGAELCGTGLSGWAGSGLPFVVESCEYKRSFLDLRPKFAAITSVEPDHFDCFTTLEDLIAAFADFAANVDPSGCLLVRHEDAAARAASESSRAPVLTFGWTPEADYWAGDVRKSAWGSRFRLFRRGQYVTELELPIPGRHNILNALAAAALAWEMGVSPRDLRSGVQAFPGIRRRFEPRGSWRGVTMIDDYAHHPTAVQSTLQAARDQYGNRRIRVAFQPHQISRTRALFDSFASSFGLADEVFVAPIYAARELGQEQVAELTSHLAEQIRASGIPAVAAKSLDHLESVLDDALEPGDVLITMGAGDIDRIHHAFTRRFFRDSATGRTTGAADLAESGRTGPVLSFSA